MGDAEQSRLAQIREFQEEGYGDFPDLGEEHVRLLLAAVDAFMLGQTLEATIAEYEDWLRELRTCKQDMTDAERILKALKALT